ncbi:MAG: PDZ domain-containing protein [Bacteroidota bacterium]
MKFNKPLLYFIAIIVFSFNSYGQRFHISKEKRFEKVRFELINNVMVVPVTLNGTQLDFILDTGVRNPILFNVTPQDSIQINNVSPITLKGLGEGEPIQALKSVHNRLELGGARSNDQAIYVVLDKDLDFSTTLGLPVHGIIGHDIFKDFIVEINYKRRHLKLYDPKYYIYDHSDKFEKVPLSIINKKAYLDAAVTTEDNTEVPVKLLVDTGSSDALWLFSDLEQGLTVPEQSYEDFLGKGLSGDIFGRRTRLKGMRIGSFVLDDAKVAFPYRNAFGAIKDLGDRNGSVGGEVLKRFTLIFDYPRQQLFLAKNADFGMPFQYNLAGIDLQHNGVRYIAESIADAQGFLRDDDHSTFGNVQLLLEHKTRLSLVPEIVVSGIRAGSPAAEAGLEEGDVILAVNGKKIHDYKLQEVLHMLNNKAGKRVRVLIERYNKDVLFTFVLKDLFKDKKP